MKSIFSNTSSFFPEEKRRMNSDDSPISPLPPYHHTGGYSLGQPEVEPLRPLHSSIPRPRSSSASSFHSLPPSALVLSDGIPASTLTPSNSIIVPNLNTDLKRPLGDIPEHRVVPSAPELEDNLEEDPRSIMLPPLSRQGSVLSYFTRQDSVPHSGSRNSLGGSSTVPSLGGSSSTNTTNTTTTGTGTDSNRQCPSCSGGTGAPPTYVESLAHPVMDNH